MISPASVDPQSTDILTNALIRARTPHLEVGELITLAEQFKAQGQGAVGVDLYKTWLAFHPDHSLYHAVAFNYAVLLSQSGDMSGTIQALNEAIRIKRDFYPPYINLGNALEASGRADSAVTVWQNLVNALPDINADTISYKSMALKQFGRVHEGAGPDAEAEVALQMSLLIDADQPEAVQHWFALRQRQCKWPVLSALPQVPLKKLKGAISPLSLACYVDDPLFQIASAYRYNQNGIGWPDTYYSAKDHPVPAAVPPRLRIGYVSSDLRDHAVGFAMTEVMELHDRSKVEVFAYYCGSVRSTDSTQERIKANVDHWIDISGMDDAAAAARIRADGVHILIDLNGYTKDARTKVFAMRPAPINVNWFGFPGTMGSPYHHYMVADSWIIPPENERFYTEKVVRLPCYQPNDRRRVISEHRPTRIEAGLPENSFVFCCLNGLQKLNALTFDLWMRILAQVPDSVLWLLSGNRLTEERLRQMAVAKGIAAERLVFAEKKANPDHLARYALADLFLDNMPYGAHTTAADSLWMGVPVLTLPGKSFASRVCASLVHAAGLDELIVNSFDAYSAKAVELGRHRDRLAVVRQRLKDNRDSCDLFNTTQLVERLEALYQDMWADFVEGRLPQPDLRNLDIYHDIAVDIDHEAAGLMNGQAFLQIYREKRAQRHEFCPVWPDTRLW